MLDVAELEADALGERFGGGRLILGFNGDELPHAGPAAAGGALLDEPAILIFDRKGPAALDGADFASGRRWHLIGEAGGEGGAVFLNGTEEALGRAGCADGRAEFHECGIEIADALLGE